MMIKIIILIKMRMNVINENDNVNDTEQYRY